eukprot:gene4174-biopygen1487
MKFHTIFMGIPKRGIFSHARGNGRHDPGSLEGHDLAQRRAVGAWVEMDIVRAGEGEGPLAYGVGAAGPLPAHLPGGDRDVRDHLLYLQPPAPVRVDDAEQALHLLPLRLSHRPVGEHDRPQPAELDGAQLPGRVLVEGQDLRPQPVDVDARGAELRPRVGCGATDFGAAGCSVQMQASNP